MLEESCVRSCLCITLQSSIRRPGWAESCARAQGWSSREERPARQEDSWDRERSPALGLQSASRLTPSNRWSRDLESQDHNSVQ